MSLGETMGMSSKNNNKSFIWGSDGGYVHDFGNYTQKRDSDGSNKTILHSGVFDYVYDNKGHSLGNVINTNGSMTYFGNNQRYINHVGNRWYVGQKYYYLSGSTLYCSDNRKCWYGVYSDEDVKNIILTEEM